MLLLWANLLDTFGEGLVSGRRKQRERMYLLGLLVGGEGVEEITLLQVIWES